MTFRTTQELPFVNREKGFTHIQHGYIAPQPLSKMAGFFSQNRREVGDEAREWACSMLVPALSRIIASAVRFSHIAHSKKHRN